MKKHLLGPPLSPGKKTALYGRFCVGISGARYYDPDIARFITQDSYLGESNVPPSLHRYLYAYSNPTVYIDLNGYEAVDSDEEWKQQLQAADFQYGRDEGVNESLQTSEFIQGRDNAQIVYISIEDPSGNNQNLIKEKEENPIQQHPGTRDNFFQLPKFKKNPNSNPLYWANNVCANVFNNLIDLANIPIHDVQYAKKHGVKKYVKDATAANVRGTVQMVEGIGNAVVEGVDYHRKTDIKQQAKDAIDLWTSADYYEGVATVGLEAYLLGKLSPKPVGGSGNGTQVFNQLDDFASKSGDSWAKLGGQLRDASKGKGNFGIGAGTRAEADAMGKAWVGEGYTVASDGKTLVSADKLRQYRPPSYKPRLDKVQANFEQRFPEQTTKQWQSNAHLDITD